jgi:hypothetical protein
MIAAFISPRLDTQLQSGGCSNSDVQQSIWIITRHKRFEDTAGWKACRASTAGIPEVGRELTLGALPRHRRVLEKSTGTMQYETARINQLHK